MENAIHFLQVSSVPSIRLIARSFSQLGKQSVELLQMRSTLLLHPIITGPVNNFLNLPFLANFYNLTGMSQTTTTFDKLAYLQLIFLHFFATYFFCQYCRLIFLIFFFPILQTYCFYIFFKYLFMQTYSLVNFINLFFANYGNLLFG